MEVKDQAASLNVQEAMKILNMTKFTAEELNKKFQYRVQSITRGLGGSLESQKSVYTAWEYLNRMLARETSNQTEEVLKKVDQTVKMLEKPKHLDMIPVRLSNTSKKASLIIQNDIESDGNPKSRKARIWSKSRKTEVKKIKDEEKRQDPEKSLGVSALPGQLLQQHLKWMEQDRLKSKKQNEKAAVNKTGSDKNLYRQGGSARLNNVAQKQPMKDLTTSQLKEIIRMDRSGRSSKEGPNVVEKQEQLGKLLAKLPKLPQTRSQTLLFKKTTALNEMFENPRKPSRYDQWTSAKRASWKEKAAQILSDRPSSGKKPKSSGKIKTRKATRRSSKQPKEQVLYRNPDLEQTKDREVAINESKLPKRHQDRPTFPEPEFTRIASNPNFLTQGPFTPSRILNWIKSSQTQEDKGTSVPH